MDKRELTNTSFMLKPPKPIRTRTFLLSQSISSAGITIHKAIVNNDDLNKM